MNLWYAIFPVMGLEREPQDGSSYPAHMQPVPFPTAEARAARTVCNRIASLLEDHLEARPAMVTSAQDSWEGAHRTEFDETWSPQSNRLSGLKEDLRRLAGRIDDAIASAATINEQRSTMRANYRADQNAPN